MAEKRSIEGYTYQQERTLDVAEAMAGSGGAGHCAALPGTEMKRLGPPAAADGPNSVL